MLALTAMTGIIVGLAFGYALQRGRFCTNSAFRDALFSGDSTLLRAWALAVVVQLVGVSALSSLGWLPVSVPPFWWAANILGGVVFGVGMVLAGGCSSGTCYRVGEGLAGSLVALVTFGIGILMMSQGLLAPLQRTLRAGVIGPAEGGGLTLPTLLGVNPWLVVAPVTLLALFWCARGRRGSYHSGGWSWPQAGGALGLIGIAAWAASSASGRDFGLSMTGPLRSWFSLLLGGGGSIDWGGMLIVGLLAGSLLSAALHGELRWRVPKSERLLQSAVGGLLMGLGAQLAGGCTIGHSLTGLSVLSVGSLVSTLSILAGAWGTTYWLFVRPTRVVRRQAPVVRPTAVTQE